MSHNENLVVRFSVILIILLVPGVSVARDAKTVEQWAERIGSELWQLANATARSDDLKNQYVKQNARIEEKSGQEMVKSISDSVGRMLSRKMDAVRCILKKAEEAAELYNASGLPDRLHLTNETIPSMNMSYFSGKYSSVNNVPVKLPESLLNTSAMYSPMNLTADSHFYNIPVNTDFSSVHVPTNVYDLDVKVNAAIQWSKALDQVFRQNYRSDPALSWQYFGSSTGILRLYPAIQWRTEGDKPDLYDCRMRSWFIESATCSKDMVILIDISGSMQGMGYSIAKTTAVEILGTLSNNDFVTIIAYTNETTEVVPCFNGTLVQATPENIAVFKDGLEKLNTTNPTILSKAFNKAFDLLETFRTSKQCNASNPCTQAIMLLTDGVPGDVAEVFAERNRLENGTYMPVRVFTYLLGRDVTKTPEIQSMACSNRGYYSHVHTLSEVREQVLKYINVIARPLVLQKDIHPLSWTHAYADISNPALATWLGLVMEHPEQKSRLITHLKGKEQGVQINEDAIYIQKPDAEDSNSSTALKTAYQEYRLLTSVSVPAFDRKGNRNNETKLANLLGVAGTDVPLDEINRLTLPYKLGVNGYAFIVSNNGYAILHPDLRPAYKGTLKLNYNSIDLTEVEVIGEDLGPRIPGEEVLTLRAALVNHRNGTLSNVTMKFHYDDYRRVTFEKRNYFYEALPGTPFGLAIALPEYGTKWINVGEEIKKNWNMGRKIMDYFRGDRWRIHPGWVYCRFHYLEGHEFDRPEDEVKFFLESLDNPDTWEWHEQYETKSDSNNTNEKVENNEESRMKQDELEPSADEDDESTVETEYATDDGDYMYPYDEKMSENENDTQPCNRKTLDDNAYYCNKELMELLVFDAKATNVSFTGRFIFSNETERQLAAMYGVFLRFVATQSGLTRWQDVGDSPDVENDSWFWNQGEENIKLEFGDLHRRAVNEPWYKGAIFQHTVDPESISVTVPTIRGADAVVTVAQAIFPKDGAQKAPAAVIGFQMPMESLYARFQDLTQDHTESNFSCASAVIDCYLIDQNGYVVVSDLNETGIFFGTVQGGVMKSMIYQGAYKPVVFYDYQALCSYPTFKGAANFLKTPFHHLAQLSAWLFTRLVWLTLQIVEFPVAWSKKDMNEDAPAPPPPPKKVIEHYACDEKRTLYIWQPKLAEHLTNVSDYPSRPFYAEKVPFTNLVLVVVNVSYPSSYERIELHPTEIRPEFYSNGGQEFPCHKLNLTHLERRGLEGCYAEDPGEDEIKDCGA
ncbi:voltage-dependent calcium channel subunit alpha-2/delta-3 isoform X1 [Neodiprion virginianus]|uniref:voltage-dependent calcium channel subunit alpha-2/delta-3 isoform X1 n=2 Tax=Neodiprion virginianus TaxID=2961670 RepID=UPI001EE6E01C|nr:voltage-dependent calcium channel subunit alpha-2/delta-3 isoform X1 [Neodiprion virginianus]